MTPGRVSGGAVRRLPWVRATLALALAGAASTALADPELVAVRSGEEVYRTLCQGCHMADGRGAVGAGAYPALTDNPALASSSFMAVVILHGRRNMPAFASTKPHEHFFAPTWLSDEEVANVINHVRSSFGNRYDDRISAAEVAALHR
jgi:mono/diheme cytochrome c family protein